MKLWLQLIGILFCSLFAGNESDVLILKTNSAEQKTIAADDIVDGYLTPPATPKISLNYCNAEERKKGNLSRQSSSDGISLNALEIDSKRHNKQEKKIILIEPAPVKQACKKAETIWMIPYIILMAPLEIIYEEKNLTTMRQEFIDNFNALPARERLERIKSGFAFCDEDGFLHEAFRHLTDSERDEYFRKIDSIDFTLR